MAPDNEDVQNGNVAFSRYFFPESRIKIDILTRDRSFLLTTPIHFDFDALDQIILNGSDF